jgi:two-component system chemotaxis sensor kinase CheA
MSPRSPESLALLREFLAECREHLETIERDLLELEADPSSRPHLASLFRAVHSIKGSCGFVELPKIEAVSHAAETLLAAVRRGERAIAGEVAGALLAMVDVIRALLVRLHADGTEGEVDVGGLIRRMEAALSGSEGSGAAGASREELLNGSADGKVRVDVGLLDKLMNLVGELVLSRNQLVQLAASAGSAHFTGPTQRLSLVTTELQGAVMKTRMQPIGNVWNRLPRVIRDLSISLGKRVRLEQSGRETELDKSIIEAIQDPLLHLVRNAIDHGVEKPEERAARGKSAEATLTLRAFHEGGMVNIEIADDGAGVDLAAVRARAVRQGLVSPERAGQLSDREAIELLFLPGFSTAERVTAVSGRGVGMDVVRTNIEQIGGTVDLSSRVGQGTVVRLKIPLTLAIIPALIVLSGGNSYAIPQASLVEVVRLEESRGQKIELVQGAPVLRLRGKLLPVAFLSEELGTPVAPATDSLAVVVLQADERTFGLVVEDIRDTEEIVVKPLWKRLRSLNVYAGATVMGDGKAALILDALGLAQRLGMSAAGTGVERALSRGATVTPAASSSHQPVLLCSVSGASRLGIPLSQVARLEELLPVQVERVGGVEVAQLRGEIVPLTYAGGREEGAEVLQVVIHSHAGRSYGLVVSQILDIVQVELKLTEQGVRPGVLGSMVIQERVTELLDVGALVRPGVAHG